MMLGKRVQQKKPKKALCVGGSFTEDRVVWTEELQEIAKKYTTTTRRRPCSRRKGSRGKEGDRELIHGGRKNFRNHCRLWWSKMEEEKSQRARRLSRGGNDQTGPPAVFFGRTMTG